MAKHKKHHPCEGEHLEREEIDVLKKSLDVEEKIEKEVEEIERDVRPRKAKSATLTFKGESTMPATIAIGKTATAVFTEFDGPGGTGNVVKPIGTVSFASDNPAVATVDPSTGVATGVSAGAANISASDSGNSITAFDVLTVTPSGGTAQSATVVLTANP